jgi:glycosyltransferase involved in cell wall biosynthesis
MKKCKVSVVVPVFNAEKYLERMLHSVLSQTLKDIEIICVNDGSTDGSEEIIRRYKKTDKRLRYFSQEKKDAGAARNLGLKQVRGKYVVFWDADDMFDKNALRLMYLRMEKKQADICVCSACEFTEETKIYETGGYLKSDLLPEKDPFCRSDIKESIFCFATNVAWNKMFKTSFLSENGLKFQEIRQANDTYLVMMAMYLAKRITCVKKYLVYYRVETDTSLTGHASETFYCPYESYIYTLEHLKKQPDFPEYSVSFKCRAVRGMLHALAIQTDFSAYKTLYDFLKKEGLKNLGIDECREEELEEAWLYRDLNRIKTMTAEEFLILKTNERRHERDRLKHTLRRVRRRLAVLFKFNNILKAFIDKNNYTP